MKPELSQYSFSELMAELKSQLPVSEMVLQHPMWNCSGQYIYKFSYYHLQSYIDANKNNRKLKKP